VNAPVIISGASGFIGRKAAVALSGAGHPVIGISRDLDRLARLPNTIERWSWERLRSIRQADADRYAGGIVLHLAGVADRQQMAGEGPATALEHAREMAAFAARARLKGVVLASSIYVSLGERGGLSEYGAHKLAIEQVFRSHAKCPMLTLRLPPVYGPGARGGMALLASLVRRGMPLPLGLARELRDYLSIASLCRLLEAAVQAGDKTWQALDGVIAEPSDGFPLTTNELVRLIGQVIGRSPRLIPVPAPIVSLLARAMGKAELAETAFQPLRSRPDAILAQQLGWKPDIRPPESLLFLRERE
jgi:UDP-glucose 4-epimerase